MQLDQRTLLCQYHYDPLDRLVASTPSAQASVQRFYQKDRLVTEIQGAVHCSIVQYEEQLLAQQQRQSGTGKTRLLAPDLQRSVLYVLDAARPNPLVYTVHGHSSSENSFLSLLGFNGERKDPYTGWYLLGNGYRPYNPALMCFTCPDSSSPFEEGGVNGYTYCGGDPVNRSDPTGHSWLALFSTFLQKAQRATGITNVFKTAPSLKQTNKATSATTSKIHNPLPGRAQRVVSAPGQTSPLENLPLEIFEKVTRTLSGSDMANLSRTSKTMNRKVSAASDSRYQNMLRINQSDSRQQIQFVISEGLIPGVAPSQMRATAFNRASVHESLRPLYNNRLIRGDIKSPEF